MSNYLATAIDAAKKAGAILSNGFFSENDSQAKDKHDIVSTLDFQSEKIILDTLQAKFPDHSFMAEETGKIEKNSRLQWYIDPLDGTSNFLLGNPYFSISIALAEDNKIILGVVYNPLLNELYTAELGKGAFLNDTPMHVSSKKEFIDAFIASAYSSDEKDIQRGLKTIESLALKCRKVVINFSPALDLCNIARGKLDGLVDNGTTPEDHAAGSLILKEAGGIIENYRSDSWDVNKIGIIASNKNFQKDLKALAV